MQAANATGPIRRHQRDGTEPVTGFDGRRYATVSKADDEIAPGEIEFGEGAPPEAHGPDQELFGATRARRRSNRTMLVRHHSLAWGRSFRNREAGWRASRRAAG